MASRDVQVNLIGRDKSASKTLDKVGDKAQKTGGKLASIGGALAGGALVTGITNFGRASVEAFKASEQSAAALDQAFAKFPALADTNADALRRLNSELAKKTVFDDDATASGQAVLAGFKLTGQEIASLTPLLQDYAAKTGKDLPTAAQDLGKAVLGQGKALKGIGIEFKDTGTAAGNLAQLQQALNDKVGGFAENQGQTAAGQAEILGNQFGEVQEQIGAKLVPALTTLATGLLTVIDFVQRNSDVIGPLVAILGGFALAVRAVNAAATAYTAVQSALNVVLALNPIGLVVIAIAALAAGLVIAWKKSETFRNIVTGAFQKVLGGVSALLGGMQGLFSALGNVPGFGWAKTAAAAIGGAKAQVDGLNRSLDRIPKRKVVTVTVNYNQNLGGLTPRQADRASAGLSLGGSGGGARAVMANSRTSAASNEPIVIVMDGRVVAETTQQRLRAAKARGAVIGLA